MAEFITNNNIFLSTKLFPFFVSKGLYPCISFNIIDFLDTTTYEWINKKKVIDISKVIQSI